MLSSKSLLSQRVTELCYNNLGHLFSSLKGELDKNNTEPYCVARFKPPAEEITHEEDASYKHADPLQLRMGAPLPEVICLVTNKLTFYKIIFPFFSLMLTNG